MTITETVSVASVTAVASVAVGMSDVGNDWSAGVDELLDVGGDDGVSVSIASMSAEEQSVAAVSAVSAEATVAVASIAAEDHSVATVATVSAVATISADKASDGGGDKAEEGEDGLQETTARQIISGTSKNATLA